MANPFDPRIGWKNKGEDGYETWGFTADEMDRMQLGISGSYSSAVQAAQDAYNALSGLTGKADKAALPVDVKDHGALGNGVVDDTAAIQAAIDAAHAEGRAVRFPSGTYRTTDTILLPDMVRIFGEMSDTRVFTEGERACVLETDTAVAFAPADAELSEVSLSISDIYFKNVRTDSTGTLFGGGLLLRASRIRYITTSNYGVILDGTLKSVSTIRDSYFFTVSDCFLRGRMFDSDVSNNYINGKAGTHNPTCFELASWDMAAVTDNYIDFFKVVFDHQANSRNVIVANNRIGRCWRVFDSTSDPQRAISGVTISGNAFRGISSAATLSYFGAADADITGGEWCVLHAPFGLVETSFTDNQLDVVDVAVKVRNYPVRSFHTSGNHYWNTTTRLDYSVSHSGTNSQDDIFIEELDNERVTSLPSASITSTQGNIVSFDKQRLIYNGTPVFNDAGTWKKYDGTSA